jgi:hypothetical protein
MSKWHLRFALERTAIATAIAIPATVADVAAGDPRASLDKTTGCAEAQSQVLVAARSILPATYFGGEKQDEFAARSNVADVAKREKTSDDPISYQGIHPASRGRAEDPSVVIAPARWHAPADTPSADRRGLTRREGGHFEHYCVVCGAWGAFGYGVTAANPGQWYCRAHRPGGPND